MVRIRERLRYRFDRSMSRGVRSSIFAILWVFSIVFVAATAIRLLLTEIFGVGPVERGNGWATQVWITFLEITDPGSMTQDIESGVGIKILAAFVGFAGLIVVSVQIALMTTAIDGRLSRLRRGRSRVVADGHTIVLGWNDRITDVVQDLVGEAKTTATVVILTDRDKQEMDEFFQEELEVGGRVDLVTRRGNPSSVADLAITRPAGCGAVIVLADCNVSAPIEQRRASDINAIKRVLAVLGAAPEDFDAPVIVEVFGSTERSVIEALAPGQVMAVDTDLVISQLLVQTSRNVGLSSVYDEVLSFSGTELDVVRRLPDVPILTFEELSYFSPNAVAIGVVWRTGAISLNPPPQTPLSELSGLVMVTADGARPRFAHSQLCTPAQIPLSRYPPESVDEDILIIGWTSKTEMVCRQFDGYLTKGSSIDVLTDATHPINPVIERLNNELNNVDVACFTGNVLNRADLEALNPPSYSQVMLLSGAESLDVATETIDAETIITLLLLREIYAAAGVAARNLTTEILDSTNRRLVSHINRNDHIVSNRMVSGLLTRLSKNPERRRIYEELFSAEGAEFYLKPITAYLHPVRWVRFVDLMRLAALRGEIAIGIQDPSNDSGPQSRHGVQMVPDKGEMLRLTPQHSLVVIANRL